MLSTVRRPHVLLHLHLFHLASQLLHLVSVWVTTQQSLLSPQIDERVFTTQQSLLSPQIDERVLFFR